NYRRFVNQIVVVAAVAVLTSATQAGITIYVDDNAPGSDNGQSWHDAFLFLQDALDYARSPFTDVDTILVAQGTYRPDQGIPRPDRTDAFELIDGVSLMGGYAGEQDDEEILPDTYNVDAFATILSGDIDDDDDPDEFPGPTYEENSCQVVVANGVGPSAVLDGFTITGAYGILPAACGATPGGGMQIINAAPTVRQCTFLRNKAAGYDFNPGGLPNNRGGGIYIEGEYFEGQTPVPVSIVNCSFFDNRAREGAGVCIAGPADQALINCVFSRNSASDTGGGVLIAEPFYGIDDPERPVEVVNCTFVQNRAQAGEGGGLSVYAIGLPLHDKGDPDLLSLARVENCIFWGNEDNEQTWDLNNDTSQIFAIWKPAYPPSSPVPDASAWTAYVSHSCIQGGWPGPGDSIIDADPLFVQAPSDCCFPHDTPGCVDPGCEATVCQVDSDCCSGEWDEDCTILAEALCEDLCSLTIGNLRLMPDSPCIDTGDNTFIQGIDTDRDGNDRLVDGDGDLSEDVDMGAYEFQCVAGGCPCDCADLPDCVVSVTDFLALLAQWGGSGSCDCAQPPDGVVNVTDFLYMLSTWGACP
ncbi:MAG: choice-of-anchor Q domain-containing protein, partial [Planctomycetota bacterium]